MKHLSARLAGLVVAAALQAACYETQYVDTVVHANGSVDRAIAQSVGLTPEAAQRPGVWRETRMVGAGPDGPWDGTLAALKAPPSEKKLFAAAGQFPTVAAIPDHYAETAKDGVTASRLVRTYTTHDLGLVTEHVWTETLTDIAGLDEMAKAREERAQINMRLLRAALDEGLGRDYEYQDYVRWVGATEINFFAVFTEAALEARARGGESPTDEEWEKLVEAIAARHGLAGVFKDNLENEVEALLTQRTGTLIRRRDGATLEPGTVNLIVEAVMQIGEGGDDGLISFNNQAEGAKFAAGMKRVVESEFGGQDALEKKGEILFERMMGVTFGNSDRPYEFSLTLPGTIVETNGTLESDSRVRWSFKLEKAFAFGYTMWCRSIEPNLPAQRAALGAERATTRAAMLRYVDLVKSNEEILKVVNRSILAQSTDPLIAYRAAVAEGQDPTLKAAAEKLAALLRLLGLQPHRTASAATATITESPGRRPTPMRGSGA